MRWFRRKPAVEKSPSEKIDEANKLMDRYAFLALVFFIIAQIAHFLGLILKSGANRP